MRDFNKIVIKIYSGNPYSYKESDPEEIIEILNLKGDFNLKRLEEYLLSQDESPITSGPYELERIYYTDGTGAGATAGELICRIWQDIPKEVKYTFLFQGVFWVLRKSIKGIYKAIDKRKATKEEKEYVKREYNTEINNIEIVEIKDSDIRIVNYKKE